MPSLLDNPDATGITQDQEMSGSQGSIKREGSRGVEGPRQLGSFDEPSAEPSSSETEEPADR